MAGLSCLQGLELPARIEAAYKDWSCLQGLKLPRAVPQRACLCQTLIRGVAFPKHYFELNMTGN